MLGAFQIGDTETMHKYYSDDCTFVQSTFDPPVAGWQNYVALYDREKAAFQGMQLIRRNTNIFVRGDVAWASYQWEFDSSWGDDSEMPGKRASPEAKPDSVFGQPRRPSKMFPSTCRFLEREERARVRA